MALKKTDFKLKQSDGSSVKDRVGTTEPVVRRWAGDSESRAILL
jgi:hypothetical protein